MKYKIMVLSVASQGDVTYATSFKETGFGLMVTDGIKTLGLGVSHPIRDSILQKARVSGSYAILSVIWTTF